MPFATKITNKLLVIIICLSSLILAGCWDRTELRDQAIVMGTGLDITDDNQIELSLQIFDPSKLQGEQGGQGGGDSFTVVSGTGKTLFDAQSKIQADFSRELFWGQNQIVVIGEKMAEKGIHNHIDFFARHAFPRLRINVFVALEEKPVDILNFSPVIEINSAEIARKIAKQKAGMSVTLKDLLQMLSSETKGTALPVLKTQKNPMGSTILTMSGTAVFKQGKMAGFIDESITRGVLWMRNENVTTSVTIEPENTKEHISFHLMESQTRLIPEIKNGKWKITIDIVTLDDAVENETNLNLMDPEITKQLEKEMEKRIKQRINQTLESVQKEMKADILGFGEAFHRQYPEQWAKVKDNWDEKLAEVEVEIKCKAEIKRPGRSTYPPGVPQDEVVD